MNEWQVPQQLAYLISQRRWPEAPGNFVIGSSVRITSGIRDEDALAGIGFPYALLAVGATTQDRWNPYLGDLTMILEVGVRTAGDDTGQTGVIGGSRGPGGSGDSAGRGVTEVAAEVLQAVGRLSDETGVRIRCTYTGAIDTQVVSQEAMVTARRYRLACKITTARSYYRPENLTKSGDVVSWTLPPDRFDRKRVRLFGKAGTTPPTYEEPGTEIVLGDPLATSVSDPQAPPYAYAVFGEYDENKGNAADPWLRNSESTELVVT